MGVSQKRKDEINKYLTKDNLIDLYINKRLSANYIAKKHFLPDFKTDASVVIDKLKEFGINTRSIKESCTDNKKEMYKKTCMKKYGVENVSQYNEVKEKKEKSTIEKYGVKNVFQSEIIKKRSKKTMLEKYGVENPCFINGIKHNGFRSSPHKKLENILDEIGIEYKSDSRSQCFKKFNEKLEKEYSPCPDIIIEELKIIIECYGDYWHGNPKKYKSSDFIGKYKGMETCQDIWEFDSIRKEHIESFGYKVYVFWEYDIKNNFKEVKKYIYELCKNKID